MPLTRGGGGGRGGGLEEGGLFFPRLALELTFTLFFSFPMAAILALP